MFVPACRALSLVLHVADFLPLPRQLPRSTNHEPQLKQPGQELESTELCTYQGTYGMEYSEWGTE
jgi:hypothetical protein